MNKIFHDYIYFDDDEYEHNNVSNCDLFNKDVFDIFKEVKVIKYTYAIMASKWNAGDCQFPTIDEYLKLRTNGLHIII